MLPPLYIRYHGDTAHLSLPLKHPDTGAPFDGAGCILISTIKAKATDADTDALVQKISTVGGISVAGTTADIELVPDDWIPLTVGTTYEGDVQAQSIATGDVLTVNRFRLQGSQDVTRSTTLAIETHTTNPPAPLGLASVILGTFPAAADLASSSFVHLSPAGLVPADASAMRPAHGFVRASVSAGEQATLYGAGALNGLSSLSPGAEYYLSATTPGQPTATPPMVGLVQPLGVAAALDTLLVDLGTTILAIS